MRAVQRVFRIAPRRCQSTLPTQPPSQPLARVSFRREQSAGAAQEALIAEDTMMSGGPKADRVAMPRPPPNVPQNQSPNYPATWSPMQNPRENAMRGSRFEQTNMAFQPQPLAAIEMIANEPIRLVPTKIAECDGGGGSLGHPKIFINLDKPGPKACGYCGIRFERAGEPHGRGQH